MRTAGTGTRNVFVLHGWFGSSAAWESLIPALDGDTYTYWFVDYRGYGRRRHVRGDFTIAEAARDVLVLADALSIHRFALVGHSMGGKVMQRIAVDAPERVVVQVGVSPVPAGQTPFDESGWALFQSAANKPEAREAIIGMTTGGRLSRHWVSRMVAQSLSGSRPEAFAAYLSAWARSDFESETRGLRVPTRVVVGTHDPAITHDVVRGTFAISYPDYSDLVLADAGHYAADETPPRLAAEIEKFMGEAWLQME